MKYSPRRRKLEIAKVVGTVRLEERGRREISGGGRISHSPHGLKAENLFCVWLFYHFRHFQGTVLSTTLCTEYSL
jgi:hypothetical protein